LPLFAKGNALFTQVGILGVKLEGSFRVSATTLIIFRHE
jgi:hypothetical protein